MSVLTRLKRLERHNNEDYVEIRRLISQGAYYDELDQRLQKLYIAYRESLGGVADDVAAAKLDAMLFGTPKNESLHFQLSERQPAITREELSERIKEVEQYINELKVDTDESI